jgi:hypothetical protein
MGVQNDRPLDRDAIERLVTIVRAVSWVESKHGTATTNQGRRDPMQCGSPQDAWWCELIVSGAPGQDRFITGPGGTNFFAGDLPAAAAARDLPETANIDGLGNKALGHDDPAFNETLSYYWAVPFLIHRTNTGAGAQTYKCGDLSRERLIDGAVAYNGGGDPAYRDKIIEALTLSGGLPLPVETLAAAARAAPAASIAAVNEAVSRVLAALPSRRTTVRVTRATLRLHAVELGGGWYVGDRSARAPECAVTVTFPAAAGPKAKSAGKLDRNGEFTRGLRTLLDQFARGRATISAEIAVPIEIQWTHESVVLRFAADAPHTLVLTVNQV